MSSGRLPDLVGIPLVIQDKGFVPRNILKVDPTWRWGDPGDLWYPHDYEVNVFEGGAANPKGRWDWGPTVDQPSVGTMPMPRVSAIPQAFFDTIVINGGVYPKVSVPPKRVRLRLLNGSEARFYHLNLYQEDRANPGEAKVGKGDPGNWTYARDPIPPDPNELGWKETVRMNPGEVTTIIMQFNLPSLPTAAMRNAVSPRTGGKEYVWHCHILEHEEHDMMRPLIVE